MTPKNARETISYIFQDATLLPWRTVTQNVGLGLELEGVDAASARERKIAALLDLVGLEHVAEGLSARAFRRNEDARFHRARAGHESAAAADGRTFRRAR